jgi:two-component sensor histidine kinase
MSADEPTELSLRRQLTAFAQFTTRSLGEHDIDALMLDACLRARAGLMMTHAKLLEYIPARDRLLMRAGIGWKPGYVAQYDVPVDISTPIGHAFVFSEPVPIPDYATAAGFQYPAILKEHGCVASINVPLRTDSGNFGVLEVDDTGARSISADDINFLTGLGNTMARAVELRRAIQAAEKALDKKQLLIREMNHRIKNNLSLVAAILQLQARRSSEPAVRDWLASAVARISNMALVHDRLQLFSSSVMAVSAAPHFQDLCDMLRSLLPAGVVLSSRCSGSIAGDHVESLTLIANELITNAAKHAFQGRQSGEITLGYREEGAGWRLWVHDDGVGRAAVGSQPSTSFGSQLIEILSARLNADVVYDVQHGTKVEIRYGLKSHRSDDGG